MSATKRPLYKVPPKSLGSFVDCVERDSVSKKLTSETKKINMYTNAKTRIPMR